MSGAQWETAMDKIKRLERERLNGTRSGWASFRQGFLRGLTAQVNISMPQKSALSYKGKGIAGDWEKVGGDIWSAMEDRTAPWAAHVRITSRNRGGMS